MSFGENKKARIAELESRIEHLEMVNGALCAEINRQERVIEEQRAQITRLVAANDARAERICELESLARDMHAELSTPGWDRQSTEVDGKCAKFDMRMAELGPTLRKAYVVDTWSDLDDIGEHYVERRVYRTREAAERRAEQVSGCDDGVRSYAAVYEFEVVDE